MKQLWKMRFAKFLINDLKNYGPAGLIHMEALSNVIGKPIRIWRSSHCFYKTINGKHVDKKAMPVDVEFHDYKSTYRQIGHWTLVGNKDPINNKTDLNGCLFSVIADQTENCPIDMRTNTVGQMANNVNTLIDRIDVILSSYGKDEPTLMIGGARYHGISPREAAIILNNSQNVYCDGCSQLGHPRGHVSDKLATGPLDSVENYSRSSGGMKSGFLSYTDQNNVAHFALSHRSAQKAMETLNQGYMNATVTLHVRDLQIAGCDLPQMKEWCNGKECSYALDIAQVTLVLRHHQGKRSDPDADVFVHTFYPRSR
ncbi:uncharacterized protein LOC116431789 [Nomia melanderi]|uniref:uncharacterized protein LOC116431789 n=1 Tax=Nomia melanderi TaxID=2448451 RepID=UPI003FCCA3C5